MALEMWLAQFSAWALAFAQAYGYFGVFVINIIASATIFFPVPAFALTFALGAVLNPWILGISAGLGSAIGELTGYILGYGGQEALKKRYRKWLNRANKFAEKRGMFAAILLIAASPIPTDIVGILAGVAKYRPWKFFVAMAFGKVIKYALIAWAGFYGLSWIAGIFGLG
ncbi:MAG: VTT domain-containing protein [Candidatus Aenigmarchaeota archaeon]|nr:VTT domain-containing protein [Candidatus Aenigmarchaeota archaeon]